MNDLLDTLGRGLLGLRLSVTDRCNFRCPYCMPAEIFGNDWAFLSGDRILNFDEMERIVRIFAKLGVGKLKITGGEPLQRPWVIDLIRRVVAIEGIEDVALITNGQLLKPMARRLREAGLDRLTVSLDALSPAVFSRMVGGRASVATVLHAIDAAVDAGFSPIKINMVVQRGINDGEVLPMVERFRSPRYLLRFIEYMDVGSHNGWNREQVVPSAELRQSIGARYPLEPVAGDHRNEVATRYRYLDGAGEVGFISSVSEPFCHSCSRARLSADGRLYTCLFSQQGVDLGTPLRAGAGDDRLEEIIRTTWRLRDDRYSEVRSRVGRREDKVEMHYIGG